MLDDIAAIAGLTAAVMFSPGPDMILVVRNTVIGGKQAGRWTCAGILTGNLVHISCCLLGIGWVIAHSTAAYTVLKLAPVHGCSGLPVSP